MTPDGPLGALLTIDESEHMRRTNLASLVSVIALLTAAPSFAETVTLRTENGAVNITGKILEFDGETYLLRSSVGDLRLAVDAVICEGAGCPVIAPLLDFAASGTTELAARYFPQLLNAYASAVGMQMSNRRDGSVQQFVTGMPDSAADATVSVSSGTSTSGLQDLLDGKSEVALTIRPVKREEDRLLKQAGIGPLQEHILTVGGLVIVTPSDNPLPSISVRDAARIFSGEVQNWAEVGGPDAQIQLFVQNTDAAVSEVFDELVLDPFGMELASTAVALNSDAELDAQVARNPYAIGFKRFSPIGAARQMPIIGQCGLVVSPTEFNIKAEEYPLSYRLQAITKPGEQSELLTSLLDFLRTDQAQDAIGSDGTISQRLGRSPVDQQGMRFASALRSDKITDAIPQLKKMVSEMVVSERLSSTFRFEAGSRELDERGRRDIERVAQLLNAETIGNTKKIVRIMGFTDSLGDPLLNQELSVRRARQVRDALLEIDPNLEGKVEFRPMGFGDVSPIGCDQTARGRWINRRVEIWVSAAAR